MSSDPHPVNRCARGDSISVDTTPGLIRRAFGATLLLSLGVFLAAGCDTGPTAPEGHSNVSIQFGTPAATAQLSMNSSALASEHDAIDIQGSNGILTIEDLRLVVDELELEGDEGSCEIPDGDDCADFEFPRFFLDLPLDGGVVVVDTEPVPLGTYKQVELEVEDIDPDEDDADEAPETRALAEEIRSEFPNWPTEASMMVRGTFTPAGGAPVAFTTFFEAELEIELDLDPVLEIDVEGANRTVTVQLEPGPLFKRADGTVLDLSQAPYNFDANGGEVVEFEVEIENGSWEVELDR